MSSVSLLKENSSYKNVKGFLNPKVLDVCELWWEFYHEKLGHRDTSPGLEIGVHHGRFFLGIEALLPDDVKCYGVDIFGSQERNIDKSGKGNLEAFSQNVNSIARQPDRVVPVEGDSFSIRSFFDLPSAFSIISIDGGHTREHAGHDLAYADSVIDAGGLVVLDDFSNTNWLGVMEGALDFLSRPDRRIAPVLVGFNKLFLTTISEAADLRGNMEEAIKQRETGLGLHRISSLRGHDVRQLKSG